MNSIMHPLASRIKRYRKKRGLTQEAVAGLLGIRVTNYAKYESGERNPKQDRLLALGKILGASYDDLISGVENKYIGLLNAYIRSAIADEDISAYYSDISFSEASEIISSFLEEWLLIIENEANAFYRKYIKASRSNAEVPTLETLIELNRLFNSYPDYKSAAIPDIDNPFDFDDKHCFCLLSVPQLPPT
jgi:transcriptional regulator with XRE-family HTH domain